MTADKISLSILSHPRYLQLVRGATEKIAGIMKFSHNDARNIVLAVDEACSNIIRHSYQNDPNGKIDFLFELCAEKLIIRITDEGLKCDIHQMVPRKMDTLRPGGLGIHIMTAVMDSLKFDCNSPRKNQVTMVKNLKTSASPDPSETKKK